MNAAVSTVPTQSMKITKVKEQIGAIVTGIDLAQPIDAATRKQLYDAVVENVVLVIRGQPTKPFPTTSNAGSSTQRPRTR